MAKTIKIQMTTELLQHVENANYLSEAYKLENVLELLDEDVSDWSFIVQVIALIETALSQMLNNTLKVAPPHSASEKLQTCFEFLPLVGKASKVSFCKAIGIIDSDAETFINKMSEIRNTYAHNFKNMNLNIFELLEEKRLKKLLESSDAQMQEFRINNSRIRHHIRQKLFAHLSLIYMLN